MAKSQCLDIPLYQADIPRYDPELEVEAVSASQRGEKVVNHYDDDEYVYKYTGLSFVLQSDTSNSFTSPLGIFVLRAARVSRAIETLTPMRAYNVAYVRHFTSATASPSAVSGRSVTSRQHHHLAVLQAQPPA